ncbi:MAG: DUF554 domain-containing protein, partial [Clostridia bacterium]|nr:DUF554 domain-containing protein [Clostridia bacterium]
MLGTVVNTIAIIVGAALGKWAGGALKDEMQKVVMQAIGLGVILVGLTMAVTTNNIIIVLVSLVLGGIVGELLALEYQLERLGQTLEKLVTSGRGETAFVKGFVSASLLYCVGAMAIMGSLESGLTGQHTTLFAKSLLDGVTAVFLASSLGWGVAFSALSVFAYQGSITMLAGWLGAFLTEPVVTEMTSTGGLLIFAIGLDLLGIKKFKIGNLLPAVFVAMALMLCLPMVKGFLY